METFWDLQREPGSEKTDLQMKPESLRENSAGEEQENFVAELLENSVQKQVASSAWGELLGIFVVKVEETEPG